MFRHVSRVQPSHIKNEEDTICQLGNPWAFQCFYLLSVSAISEQNKLLFIGSYFTVRIHCPKPQEDYDTKIPCRDVCASDVVRWAPAIFLKTWTLDMYQPNASVSTSRDLLWEHTHIERYAHLNTQSLCQGLSKLYTSIFSSQEALQKAM